MPRLSILFAFTSDCRLVGFKVTGQEDRFALRKLVDLNAPTEEHWERMLLCTDDFGANEHGIEQDAHFGYSHVELDGESHTVELYVTPDALARLRLRIKLARIRFGMSA